MIEKMKDSPLTEKQIYREIAQRVIVRAVQDCNLTGGYGATLRHQKDDATRFLKSLERSIYSVILGLSDRDIKKIQKAAGIL